MDLLIELFAEVELADFFNVVLDHDADEVGEGGLVGIPAETVAGFGGIAEELIDFCGTEVFGIDFDEGLAEERPIPGPSL